MINKKLITGSKVAVIIIIFLAKIKHISLSFSFWLTDICFLRNTIKKNPFKMTF